jgi:hypothetical protein
MVSEDVLKNIKGDIMYEDRVHVVKAIAFQRRGLGYWPINGYVKSYDCHHLHIKCIKEVDENAICIYVPPDVHRSVPHRPSNKHSMCLINFRCLEWYLKVEGDGASVIAKILYIHYADVLGINENDRVKCEYELWTGTL